MSEDLKSMLGKVLHSRGRKSFAFAYATGKRTDGKGDGHLHLVAGRKSFKKDDVAEEVDKIGFFLQGRCWSDSDGKSIFIQGKGLNHTLVVKMKLTAKTVTGRSYDLQLPDPDEERRQADSEDSEEEEGRTPPTSESEDESAAAELAEVPQAPPPPEKGAMKSAAAAGAASGASGAAAGTFQTLLAGIKAPLAKLDGTDPALAAKIRKILTAAQGYAAKADFDKAVTFLKEAGKVLSGAGLPKTDGAAKDKVEAVPAASNVKAIQTLLKKLGYDPGAIDGKTGPHTTAAIKKFQQASGLKPDGIVGPKTQAAMKQALQGGARPAGVKEDGRAPAPAGTPGQGNRSGQAAWQAARKEAFDDLQILMKKVLATKHGDAPAVIKEIHSITKNLPEKPTATEIDKLEAYIRHEDVITAAEEVPGHFHKLNIREPLLAALEGLKQGV